MRDVDGKYKLWWCGSNWTPSNPGGDNIYYSEAPSASGPWTTPQLVFSPSTFPGGFDANHTCDPSVVRVGGHYYLYYTGITNAPSDISKIGVVRSPNGKSGWVALNGGNPIVTPSDPNATVQAGYYGAGTPSVVFKDGWFYMLYQDDTGFGSPSPHGYVLRSKSATFPANSNTQQLQQSGSTVGFLPLGSAQRYAIWNTTNADLVYHDGLRQFMVANTGATFNQLTVLFFNEAFVPACAPAYFNNARGRVDVTAYWTEGPGVLRTAAGHALFLDSNIGEPTCRVPLDFYRSVGDPGHLNAHTWNLSYVGVDAISPDRCGDVISRVPLDYDGDRASDYVIFRPSTPGFWIRNSVLGDQIHGIGSANSIPIQGDFDGDGKADRGIVTPQLIAGTTYLNWYIEMSGGGASWTQPTWGLGTDQIAIADYNGDGRDDIAVFRPSDGSWWIVFSGGGTAVYYWGESGDVAVPEDYDGDGKADLAILRPSTDQWWIWHSSGGYTIDSVTGDGCIPVPGDYSGDGRADIACWRSANARFYAKKISTGASFKRYFGLPGDIPIRGDFNGDGRLDITVWRPSDGTWYHSFQRWSTQIGTGHMQWGIGTDLIPTQ